MELHTIIASCAGVLTALGGWEFVKEVKVEFEKLSEESIAKLIQENGFKAGGGIDLLGL